MSLVVGGDNKDSSDSNIVAVFRTMLLILLFIIKYDTLVDWLSKYYIVAVVSEYLCLLVGHGLSYPMFP